MKVGKILVYLIGSISRLSKPLRNLKLLLRAKSPMIRFSLGMMVHEPPEISGLALKTQKQRKALEFVLGNIWKYGTSPIHFSLRNQRNVPKRYTPSLIGNKPIRSVLYALRGLGLIEIETGTSKFTYNQNWELEEPWLSSFTATSVIRQLHDCRCPSNAITSLHKPRTPQNVRPCLYLSARGYGHLRRGRGLMVRLHLENA